MQKMTFEMTSVPYAKLMRKKTTPKVMAMTATILMNLATSQEIRVSPDSAVWASEAI